MLYRIIIVIVWFVVLPLLQVFEIISFYNNGEYVINNILLQWIYFVSANTILLIPLGFFIAGIVSLYIIIRSFIKWEW